MSTLVLFTASRADAPDALEGLRVVAALVATGDTPRVVELGAGVGRLTSADVPEAAAETLDALETFGVRPESLDRTALLDAVRTCARIVRIGAGDRSRDPALLVVDAAALERALRDPEWFEAALANSGQVIRAP